MNVKLPRLPINWQDQPRLFDRYWDQAMSQIEDNINQLLNLPAIQDAIVAAQTAANTANTAANAANTAANTANTAVQKAVSESSLNKSYVDLTSFTAPLLSADSAGVVTIASHVRIYGDSSLNPSTAVVGGSLSTGTPSGSVIRVYYNDASRSGGAVSYLYTVDPAAPPVQTGNTHVVGTIVVPASGVAAGAFIKNIGYVEQL